jgi:hypothetical protein
MSTNISLKKVVRESPPSRRRRCVRSMRSATHLLNLGHAERSPRMGSPTSWNSVDRYSRCGLDHPGAVDVIHDAFDPLPDYVETDD